MIISRLIGGLGNQMFQYAAAKQLAVINGIELKLDISFLQKKTDEYTQRHFELGNFKGNFLIASQKEVDAYMKHIDNRFFRVAHRMLPNLFKHTYIAESGHQFHPEFLKYPDNTYLNGFWQSELYFKNIEQQIRADFTFNDKVIGLSSNWRDKISNVNSVSLHVRRGDYVSLSSANVFHGVCSIEYYKQAVQKIISTVGDVELFIFSDDLEWCRQNLMFNMPTHFVNTNDMFQDLYLMTQCKHNIIANSSFSWWGAWLNCNNNKVVITPDPWFAVKSINTKDIIPENWIKIHI